MSGVNRGDLIDRLANERVWELMPSPGVDWMGRPIGHRFYRCLCSSPRVRIDRWAVVGEPTAPDDLLLTIEELRNRWNELFLVVDAAAIAAHYWKDAMGEHIEVPYVFKDADGTPRIWLVRCSMSGGTQYVLQIDGMDRDSDGTIRVEGAYKLIAQVPPYNAEMIPSQDNKWSWADLAQALK